MYDIIIIGGGIGGLYTAYELLKKDKNQSILIVEKESILGGRIDTYEDKYMRVEAGAGRFHEDHKLLIKLLKELKLTSKIQKISPNRMYAPSERPGIFEPETRRNDWIKKVIEKSEHEKKEILINQSFVEYAKKILTIEEVEYIKDSFGYYTELVIMNAYDTIHLIKDHLSENIQFYSLAGGLSQIIEELEKKIKSYKNAKILCNHAVSEIIYKESENQNQMEIICIDQNSKKKQKYESKKCICAVTKGVLETMKIFRPIYPILQKIKSAPLCRIYSKFKEPWFENIPKITTNTNLRMIIPYNIKSGVIMISYTDNKYAEYWKRIYDKEGEEGLNKNLKKQIKKSINVEIPDPIKTNIFYWSHGVGYWGIGADSEKIGKRITKPFPTMELYICGENYSEKNQQWMEGALDTAQKVLQKI